MYIIIKRTVTWCASVITAGTGALEMICPKARYSANLQLIEIIIADFAGTVGTEALEMILSIILRDYNWAS